MISKVNNHLIEQEIAHEENENKKITNIAEEQEDSSNTNIENDIKLIKKQVKNLLGDNVKLIKKLVKSDFKKKDLISDNDIINFLEKYEAKVRLQDKNINNSNANKTDKKGYSELFNKKEKEIKILFDEAKSNFNNLKSEVKDIQGKITEISKIQKKRADDSKTGFEGDHLVVENNLRVNGETLSKTISSKSLNLDNIQIHDNTIHVKEDTKLTIDNQTFNFSQINNIVNFIETFHSKCGDNLDRCKLISDLQRQKKDEAKKMIGENFKKSKRRLQSRNH